MTKRFKAGQYVRTSKGNVGVINIPSHYEVGYYQGEEWKVGMKFPIDTDQEDIQEYIESYGRLYHQVPQVATINNTVQLGNTEVIISSDKLTFIDPLIIEIVDSRGKATITLDAEDANTIVKIFKKNNVGFKII